MQKKGRYAGLVVVAFIALAIIFSGDKESSETTLSPQNNTTIKRIWLIASSFVPDSLMDNSGKKTIQSTELSITEQSLASSCTADSECVPVSCCHARSCVSVSEKPACNGIRCTQSCEPDTLDCGQAHCGCVENKCTVVGE